MEAAHREEVADGAEVEEIRRPGSVEGIGLAWVSGDGGLVGGAGVAGGGWGAVLGLGVVEEEDEERE